MSRSPLFLIGIGQDSHRLITAENQEKLFLGGLPFACGLKFEANSDGDIVLHALCNAISTALGGGSFSTIADSLCQSGVTDSKAYLQPFLQQLQQRSYRLSNLSISVEGLQPKLEKYNLAIRKSLAHLLNLPVEFIGLAFTTGEQLTACGQGEGMSATVIISLEHY